MVGRTKKNKLRNLKVARQINDNLLKISIRTENYIYNNEPITIREAKQMKDELSTYKRLTKKDVRTLQIIEKQTRLLQGIIREEENILKAIEIANDKDKHISDATSTDGKVEPKRSVDIHINTSVSGSPTFNFNNTRLVDTSNNLGARNSPTIDLSGAIVNTQTRSDDKTIDNTPETISLPSQDDTNIKQLDVVISLDKQNTKLEQSHHLPKKRRNDKDKHISVATSTDGKYKAKKSVDIHINTSVSGSHTFNLNNTRLVDTSNTFGATNSPTIDLSGAIVNTQTRSDDKTIDNTPETISLPSQDDTNVKQLEVDKALDKQNSKFEQSHHLPKKRRNYKDKHISVATSTDGKDEAKKSVDIHINTSVSGSPTFNLNNTRLVDTPNAFGATNSLTIDLSGAIVNTQTRSDDIKTIDNTSETISLPSQHDTNVKQLDVDISLVKQNTKLEQSHHLPKKRRKNANNLSWMDNIKYVRVVEDDEFDPKLSNLGKIWDNFQLPQDWDESDFSFD